MDAFLSDASVGPAWVSYGCLTTLASYGVRAPSKLSDVKGWERVREALAAALPESHRDLLRRLPLTTQVGDYLFVHAGVRPGVSLEAQSPDDQLWIRQLFLDSADSCAPVLVHGHTREPGVTMTAARIGVDTGAYAIGLLSAARLEEFAREVLQIRLTTSGHEGQAPHPTGYLTKP